MCVCVQHVHEVLTEASQMRVLVSGPLKLELLVVVSYHVDAGSQTWVLWKSALITSKVVALVSSSRIFIEI